MLLHCLVFVSLCLPAPAARAQNVSPLTLETLLEEVDRRFPKLRAADAKIAAAEGKRVAKQGAFDPQWTASADSLRYNSASTRGKAGRFSGAEVGIEVATPAGPKFGAGIAKNAGAVKSPGSSTGDDGAYFLALKWPLLRDAGINEKAAALIQARLEPPAAQAERDLARIAARQEAALAYFEWIGALRRQRIADELLRAAGDRADFIAREIAAGARPRIDASEADAEVALRRERQTKALRDREKAALKLLKFLGDALPPGPEQAPENALTPPAPLLDAQIEEGRRRAETLRPEWRQIVLARQRLEVERQLARGDLRPRLDVVVSPGLDLGPRGVGETWKAGIDFSVPLYRREAKGRLLEAEQKSLALDQEEALLRQTLRLEVDDAASAIRRAAERYADAERSLALTRRVEEGERLRFREGDSTLFLINQRERATAEAAQRLVDIHVEYEQARIAFRAATMQI